MKWFFAGFLTIIILLVVAVFNIPASVLPRLIAEFESRGLIAANAPKVMLTDMKGTIWDGHASKTVVTIDGVPVELGELNWQLDKLSLLHRNPRLDVTTHSEKITLLASLSAVESGEITIRGLEGRLPISVLEPWFPMLVTGDIAFVVDHVVFTQQQMLSLDGLLNLEYVDWVGADYNMPLGSYMAQLSLADNNDLLILINDFAATLGIKGTFRMNPRGSYQFDAVLQARKDLAPEVAKAIGWLGKRNADGNVVIQRRGRL